MLSLFRLALIKIVLENPCTNPMRTSSKKVKSNKGAGGVDGMGVDELLGFLKTTKSN
jgi:hypothetical protein